MLRQVAKRATQGANDALSQGRSFYSLSLEFTEDVSGSKPKAGGPNLVGQWAAKKAETETALKMITTYKDLGDLAEEPLLKNHNPRTFEDLEKPIPNFKKFGLKAGDVPRFFDGVLQARASAAVDAKNQWWAARQETVQEALKERTFKPFTPLPVPSWSLGQPVPLAALKASTDRLFAQLEPKRKLAAPDVASPAVSGALAAMAQALGADAGPALAESVRKALASKVVVTEGGKPVAGRFMGAAEAETKIGARRAELHTRFVKMWAKRVLAMPEQALIPLKERDALLASKFEDVSEQYHELVDLVARGTETYGERLASCAAMDTFFLRRSKEEVKGMFPPTEQEKEAVALAQQLSDPSAALSKLLGPALTPPGSGGALKSAEAAALADHLYGPDRYMGAEGMKLAARYRAEEEARAAELTALYGDASSLAESQRAPKAPLAALAEAAKEGAAKAKALAAEKAAAAGNAYLEYALDKQIAFVSDPSNTAFEDVLHPELVQERYEIEMAELDALEAQMNEAEEEELWLITLQRQARHIQQHLEFDLPQAQYAHMDPILYKKLDWEVTHSLDIMHHEVFQAADCEQGEYVKDQMGLENLSHHLLPLIRYRRAKARAARGYYAPELTALPVAATPAADVAIN